uniref:Zinc transporter 6 n=1 Tax=Ditylenchus dipsaci TaxID=166011 RepID=A0A915CZS9_9BILA
MVDLAMGKLLSYSVGRNAALASVLCMLTSLFLVYSVSVTRSLVITGQAWISVFSFFALFSAVISLSTSAQSNNKNYTFGLIRAPVLAVFSTTVLAQLSSVFLIKESVERLFEVGHHHGGSAAANNYFYASAVASSLSLVAAAYAVTNQPFNYVLRSAQSSVIQEHAADICHALCHVVPGLSRLLLPRINSLSLLAIVSGSCCVLTHWFMTDYWWFDSVAALILSFTVFATMMPLSTYTGRILLQTTPPHVHNQIDRCISEASTVEGVLELKNGHFWQLDFNSIAGTVDVRVRRDANEQIVLTRVTEKLSTVVNILSVQILKDITTTWANNPQNGHNMATLAGNFGGHSSRDSSAHGHSHNSPSNDAHGHSHNNGVEDNHGHSHNGHGHSHGAYGHSH